MIIDRMMHSGPRVVSRRRVMFFEVPDPPLEFVPTCNEMHSLDSVSRWILHQIKLLRRLLYPAESRSCQIVLVVLVLFITILGNLYLPGKQ
jgi:hypothetical protein